MSFQAVLSDEVVQEFMAAAGPENVSSAEHELVAGTDDKVFRLDRTNNRECASLVTDRKVLAALRRK